MLALKLEKGLKEEVKISNGHSLNKVTFVFFLICSEYIFFIISPIFTICFSPSSYLTNNPFFEKIALDKEMSRLDYLCHSDDCARIKF